MAVLEIDGVGKRFGGVEALSGCSLTVEEGSITGLIGPNGSGKTTLFNTVTGHLPPDTGLVRLRGRRVDRLTPDRIYTLGMARTFQQVRVFGRLTVLENVLVGSSQGSVGRAMVTRTAGPERDRAMDLLRFFRIDGLSSVPAGSLSFGQRKLLELASVLIGEPRVLLLDEPAGGVNPIMTAQLAGYIRTLNGQGITFLVVEHNMEFVMGLSEKIVVMARGRVLAEGTPAQVRADPRVLEAYLGV